MGPFMADGGLEFRWSSMCRRGSFRRWVSIEGLLNDGAFVDPQEVVRLLDGSATIDGSGAAMASLRARACNTLAPHTCPSASTASNVYLQSWKAVQYTMDILETTSGAVFLYHRRDDDKRCGRIGWRMTQVLPNEDSRRRSYRGVTYLGL